MLMPFPYTFPDKFHPAVSIGSLLLLAAFVLTCSTSMTFALPASGHKIAAPLQRSFIRVQKLPFDVQDIEVSAGGSAAVSLALPSQAELERQGVRQSIFILVRNVPKTIRLSDGLPSGRVWIVTLPQANNLQLSASAEDSGVYELEFNLMGPDNRVLAQKTVALNVQSPLTVSATENTERLSQRGEDVSPPPVSVQVPEENSASSPAAPALSRAEETVLLRRGKQILREGGFAAARIIFEELATRGSEKGAYALARTYDPVFVRNAPELGITADISQALKWYERAAELGSADAERRRAELAAGQ